MGHPKVAVAVVVDFVRTEDGRYYRQAPRSHVLRADFRLLSMHIEALVCVCGGGGSSSLYANRSVGAYDPMLCPTRSPRRSSTARPRRTSPPRRSIAPARASARCWVGRQPLPSSRPRRRAGVGRAQAPWPVDRPTAPRPSPAARSRFQRWRCVFVLTYLRTLLI